jgi:hypothetical protein
MKNMMIMLFMLSVALILMTGCAKEKVIGGERDEHGCLGPAGYSWNEDIGACIREFELDESQRKAAKIAVAPISSRPMTVVEVMTLKCPGCFSVRLESIDNHMVDIPIINWQIGDTSVEITNFDECVAAGNPVMESLPRQCSANGQTFTEEIGINPNDERILPVGCDDVPNPENGMTKEDAILKYLGSECQEKAYLKEGCMYNENSKTWWFNLDAKPEYVNPLCSPACVIDENGNAEINWRCTGAMPPNPEVECNTDDDCACGTHMITGECFVGNKEYVNTSKQCPDFCTGIAANFVTRCENHVCRNVNILDEVKACSADAKLCPDGSSVGRIAPDCEFAPCPGEETCENLCGDGTCQEIVCMAVGYPCAETKDSCPSDCR